MAHDLPPEAAAELKRLQRELPSGTEMEGLLQRLDDPASDEASKDRYVGLVAAGAVERALQLALHWHASLDSARPSSFASLIDQAAKKGILTAEEAMEIHRIREIRNVFAHALGPVSFETPAIAEVSKMLRHHPVTNWAGYFAPLFSARKMYAIVCGEYFCRIMRGVTSAAA